MITTYIRHRDLVKVLARQGYLMLRLDDFASVLEARRAARAAGSALNVIVHTHVVAHAGLLGVWIAREAE